jgi:hypothetical protein
VYCQARLQGDFERDCTAADGNGFTAHFVAASLALRDQGREQFHIVAFDSNSPRR